MEKVYVALYKAFNGKLCKSEESCIEYENELRKGQLTEYEKGLLVPNLKELLELHEQLFQFDPIIVNQNNSFKNPKLAATKKLLPEVLKLALEESGLEFVTKYDEDTKSYKVVFKQNLK